MEILRNLLDFFFGNLGLLILLCFLP